MDNSKPQEANLSPRNESHKELWDFVFKRLNDVQRQQWKSLKTEKGQRRFIKNFCKNDFNSLVFMLGYRDLGSFHDKEIKALSHVRILTDEPVRRLWLWSRGFFKTSLITEAHSVFLIINNPNIRILLPSFTISISEDILRNIKNKFISNALFRYYFSEFCPQPNNVGKIEFGTVQDFTIPNRTKVLKEPTMMCAGVGTNLTGLHFDYMKPDDLVTRDSVTNDTQIQASKDYYASLRHLFDKVAVPREDICGTIYHFFDLYSELIKSNLFKVSFIPARINGIVVFPERLNDEDLDKLISDPSVGPYQFATQYMLNPVNPAEAKFKQEWIKYYDLVPDGCVEYILCDPASTTKKKSDYTVIERWSVDSEGRTYLKEGVRDKLTAFQRIDLLFEFVAHAKNLKEVKYEVIGGRHGDLEVIEQRQRQEKIYFKVVETKGTTVSKADRIEQRLVGQYHAGMVLLPHELYFISKYDGKVHNFVQDLLLEYLQFPFTEHDDCLDTQAQLFEDKIVRGVKTVVSQRNEGVTADQWDKMYKEIDKWKTILPGKSNQEVLHRIYSRKLGNHLRFNAIRRQP